MKRGIALLAVLAFLSCTAAGYLYIQRMQEPEVQEEQVEQTEPVAKEEAVIGENAEIVYQYYYTEDRSENCGAGGTCAELSVGFESGTGAQYL